MKDEPERSQHFRLHPYCEFVINSAEGEEIGSEWAKEVKDTQRNGLGAFLISSTDLENWGNKDTSLFVLAYRPSRFHLLAPDNLQWFMDFHNKSVRRHRWMVGLRWVIWPAAIVAFVFSNEGSLTAYWAMLACFAILIVFSIYERLVVPQHYAEKLDTLPKIELPPKVTAALSEALKPLFSWREFFKAVLLHAPEKITEKIAEVATQAAGVGPVITVLTRVGTKLGTDHVVGLMSREGESDKPASPPHPSEPARNSSLRKPFIGS